MRGINRLSARFVSNVRKPGRYNDGHGLYLQVDATRKSWLFRYTRLGRHQWMGLGPLCDVSLLEARERAKEARQVLVDGRDPVTAKRAAKSALAGGSPRLDV